MALPSYLFSCANLFTHLCLFVCLRIQNQSSCFCLDICLPECTMPQCTTTATKWKYGNPAVSFQILDNLSLSLCNYKTKKAMTTSMVSFERYFTEIQNDHGICYVLLIAWMWNTDVQYVSFVFVFVFFFVWFFVYFFCLFACESCLRHMTSDA